MATIHKNSSVATLPEFDLFSVPPTQLYVSDDIQQEITPFTTITNNLTPVQFVTHTGKDEYVNLRKSELVVWMKISIRNLAAKSSGVLTENDWKKICPINYILNTMWKNITLEIGNTPVTSTTLNYSYIAYLDALLNIPEEVKNTHLVTAGWYKDKAGEMDNINAIRSADIRPINGDYNNGVLVKYRGYLHLDLCAQRRQLLGDLDIKITFYPHDPKFYLMYDSTIEPVVEFQKISFDFHKSKVIPQLVTSHAKALNITPAKYFLFRKEVKNYIIQKDALEYNENMAIKNAVLPRKAYLFFVHNEAYLGTPKMNPFNFKNYDIENVRLTIGSKDYPPRGYECNFEAKHVNQSYRGLFEALGQIDFPLCSITREEYINGYTIFGNNFIPDLSNGINRSGYTSAIRDGDMSFHIRFKRPLPETACALLLLEYDGLIEIGNTRLPIKNFQ